MLSNLILASSIFGMIGANPIPQSYDQISYRQCSSASWYGPGFHGNRTANGERFNQYSLTAAHKTLPFGTRLRVTNRNNGRSVIVRINDRGPYVGGRALDLSKSAAQTVGMIKSGHAPVCYSII